MLAIDMILIVIINNHWVTDFYFTVTQQRNSM